MGAVASGQALATAHAGAACRPLAVAADDHFKARFCRHFGCAEEKFEQELFWRTLPPLTRVPAWFISRLAPRYFVQEFQFLQALGKVRGFDELRINANSAHWSPSLRIGVMRQWLRIRISGRRLLRVGTDVLLD